MIVTKHVTFTLALYHHHKHQHLFFFILITLFWGESLWSYTSFWPTSYTHLYHHYLHHQMMIIFQRNVYTKSDQIVTNEKGIFLKDRWLFNITLMAIINTLLRLKMRMLINWLFQNVIICVLTNINCQHCFVHWWTLIFRCSSSSISVHKLRFWDLGAKRILHYRSRNSSKSFCFRSLKIDIFRWIYFRRSLEWKSADKRAW